MLYVGHGRKNKKIPHLVALSSPSMKWRQTVFQCLRTLKTSQTYPKWEWELI